MQYQYISLLATNNNNNTSTGLEIALGLFNYLSKRKINTEDLTCLGGDNTNANSGYQVRLNVYK